MRVCLQCDHSFLSANWECPSCNHQPVQQDGFRLFAPELAKNNEGFPLGRYPALAKVESENFWFQSRNKLVVKALDRHFGNFKNFLEIGCGTGFVLSGVNSAYPEVSLSASEINIEGLPFVRQRVGKAQVFQMDARRIPFREEFDVIGAFDVIEHITDDETVLAQIYSACKPGGGVIITVPQHPWMWSPLDTHSHHKRRYTRKELVHKIQEAGFEVVETISFVSVLFPLMLYSRLKAATEKNFDPLQIWALPKSVNRILGWVMRFERVLIASGIRFPFGGSLLCVGKKAE